MCLCVRSVYRALRVHCAYFAIMFTKFEFIVGLSFVVNASLVSFCCFIFPFCTVGKVQFQEPLKIYTDECEIQVGMRQGRGRSFL